MPVDVFAAIDRFLASPGLAESTRRSYGFDLRDFARWLEQPVSTSTTSIPARSPTTRRSSAATAAGSRRRRSSGGSPRCDRSFASRSAGARARRGAGATPAPAPPGCAEARRGRALIVARSPATSRSRCATRALVELVYSCGLRSAEAVALDLGDVDFDQEAVHVRGKGGKERVVPLGEEAAHRLARYLRDGLRRSPGERTTRCFSPRTDGDSTRARCGGSSPTRTGCVTHTRPTCSRGAPTSGRSRSSLVTPRSRRRRSTAMSTRSASAASTTARTRARDDPGRAGTAPAPANRVPQRTTSQACRTQTPTSSASCSFSPRNARRGRWTPTAATSQPSAPSAAGRSPRRRPRSSSAGSPQMRADGLAATTIARRAAALRSFFRQLVLLGQRATTRPPSSSCRAGPARSHARSRPPRPSG